MESQEEKENIARAKQAISPNGLENQSVEGDSGVGAELPNSDLPDEKLPNDDLADEFTDGDNDPGANVHMMHPNRNPNPKPDLDKPSYS